MILLWLIIKFILLVNYIESTCSRIIVDNNTTNNKNKNIKNKQSYNTLEDLEHKCVREVLKTYLEYDRNYTIISEGKSRKFVYNKIEVCCDGYKRSKYDWNKCVPDCTNCDHGVCLEPGYCKCFPNYVKNHEDQCVLTCPVDCNNGQCKADGTCKCNPGYVLDESEKFCRPFCDKRNDCESNYYQYCSAPNICSCKKGYQIARYRCEPICKNNCGVNGTCESPNVCRCHSGAILKNGICQAPCYQKCENGICVSPNRCICFDGYTYDQKTTSCIPEERLLRSIDIESMDI
ncbi:epidermal growth factor-like protein [Condylostylus longicornis]|uniref:epidermal growth factor-like protein n=1 Tax=Condylostylus longicornis TaxID=2530218 RepID=UPI00244E0FEE|nr:epidermal growth factor-like protein [Condylostylus longicornis]